jgi:5-(carboxyamino)imidazole ribonucleotide mutase
VATVGINGARNAAILACQILAVGDAEVGAKVIGFKESLKQKIVKANEELATIKYRFKTN